MDRTKSAWVSYQLRIEPAVYKKLRLEAFKGNTKMTRLVRLALHEFIERHYGRKENK